VAGRLRRFLHLERPRRDGPDGEDEHSRAERDARFSSLERAHQPPVETATGAAAGRFGPDPEPTLELVEKEAGARPFQRCLRCGRDHGLFEAVCSGCGAGLDTPEQQAFNEQLWADRQAEEARAAAELAEAAERRQREEAELARMRREMGIELARQVGQRERARLGMDTGTLGELAGGAPLGLVLLRLFPAEWQVRVAIGAASAWVIALLVALGRRSPGAIFLVVVVGIGLAAPRTRWRGRGDWF
jgi:hypothetical protein